MGLKPSNYEQGREVGPREKKKRAQMLARALRKVGYEVTITPINQLAAKLAYVQRPGGIFDGAL